MSSTRTEAETELLKQEAEMRSRGGESRADISIALGVPVSTLSDWALKGRWRRKDILNVDQLNVDQIVDRAHLREVALRHAGRRRSLLDLTARARLQAEATGAAMLEADPAGDGLPLSGPEPRPVERDDLTPQQLSMAMAHSLLAQGRLADAERAARFAVRYVQAETASEERAASVWRQDRERILKWWAEQREGINSLRRRAVEMAEEIEAGSARQEEMLAKGRCPECSLSIYRPDPDDPIDPDEMYDGDDDFEAAGAGAGFENGPESSNGQ
ncbi:MAG: hypothetical protein Q8R02_08400 [Hyphomonadaceae bacterium]|nr:hypothetical protein [Hyphomonadaceae bacterium]